MSATQDNGNSGAPGLSPLPTNVNVRSIPTPVPLVVVTFTTPQGQNTFFLAPDDIAGVVKLLESAATHARSGLIITDERGQQT